jgi:putative membrane protein
MERSTFSRRASDQELDPQSTTAKVIDFVRHSDSPVRGFISDSASKIKEQFSPNRDAVPWKGLLAGLAAGFAATVAMTLFQLSWSGIQHKLQQTAAHKPENSQENQGSGEESSTVKLANVVSQAVVHRPLTDDEKEPASYVVHFAFGTLMGGVYGISSEYLPVARLGHGLFHGLALWAGADALTIPALGFSRPANERSPVELTYELLAHAVYGVSSENAREAVRGLLD